MKTFAATAIFQTRLCSRWPRNIRFRGMSRMAEALAYTQDSKKQKRPTFESLGLQPRLVEAVRLAFPNVTIPTATQTRLIPAIQAKKDIVLQDETGSGKTFGLVLACLNKPKFRFSDSGTHSITTIFLVPHRELALQIRHWVQKITECSSEKPPPVEEVAQVLLRDGQMHLQSGMELLLKTPPHLLIATPASLLELVQKRSNIIDFSRVSTVVVDEVDYLIETASDTKPSLAAKIQKRIAKHPGPTRQILDIIFRGRKKLTARNREEFVDEPYRTPQLILSSATIRRHLKDYFFGESGLLSGDVEKVRGTILPLHVKEMLSASMMHTNISHHVLVASDETIENISGAADEPEEETDLLNVAANTSTDNESPALIPVKTEAELARELDFSMSASPLNQNMLEAVAAAFACYVPSVALLVIPGSASIHRAVYDLRAMGVNAMNVDMHTDSKGRLHLLSGGADRHKTNPILLVTSVAAMRGLDLPDLEHIFILGMLELEGKEVTSRTLDGYIHLAGRVGRFGKRGRAISIIEDDPREVKQMQKVLQRLGIQPVRLKQFPLRTGAYIA